MGDNPETPSGSNILRQEHAVILRVLQVLQRLLERYERAGSFEVESFGKCVEFFRLFADACHHAKEEDLLFPLLQQRGLPSEGGPIGQMLYEHGIARSLTQRMAEALTNRNERQQEGEEQFTIAAQQYIDLLSSHIFKEDNILFNMGDQALSADDCAQLCDQYCDVGCRSFEGKTKDELARIADELEVQWPCE